MSDKFEFTCPKCGATDGFLFGENIYEKTLICECGYMEVIEQKIQRPQPNIPKCPICGSTDLSKITATQKAGKAVLFGLFAAGDMSKTWKCNKCGSKF